MRSRGPRCARRPRPRMPGSGVRGAGCSPRPRSTSAGCRCWCGRCWRGSSRGSWICRCRSGLLVSRLPLSLFSLVRRGRRYTAMVPTQLRTLLGEGGAGLAALAAFDAVILGAGRDLGAAARGCGRGRGACGARVRHDRDRERLRLRRQTAGRCRGAPRRGQRLARGGSSSPGPCWPRVTGASPS